MTPTLKSKKSQNVKQSEDIEWVLEGIVGYLRSPAWCTPVMNYFDDNCNCFEDKEENKFEYTGIHINYKSLVEKLLAQYISELHVSEDLFSQACNQHTSTLDGVQGLFEYIWAADDFLLFKRLMINHNLEIEMQALNLLQLQDEPSTSRKSSFRVNEEFDMKEILNVSKEDFAALIKKTQDIEQQEAMDLKRAIEYSKLEMDRLNAQAEEERRMLEEAIRLSLEYANLASDTKETTAASAPPVPNLPSSSNSHETRRSSHETKRSSHETKRSSHETKSISRETKPKKTPSSTFVPKSLPPLREKSGKEAALDWLSSAQKDASTEGLQTSQEPTAATSDFDLNAKHPEIDPAELAKRKLYLQEQRDKLLAAKKKKREAELLQYQSESPGANNFKEDEDDVKSDSEKKKIMTARRALADRLKREVIQRKK